MTWWLMTYFIYNENITFKPSNLSPREYPHLAQNQMA